MFKYVAVAKILKKHKPSVDSFVMRLHYRTTFIILTISASLVTAKEYFGSPIDCWTRNTVPGDVLNIYCFIMSTFSVPRHFAKPLGDGLNRTYAFYGLGDHAPDEEIIYHAYYQWVPLVLYFMAILFYLPRYVWKNIEGGMFNVILGGMDQPEMEEKKRTDKHRILTAYMVKHLNQHNFWAFRFFFCELLSFAIVIFNIFLTDHFLGGTFFRYGTEAINFPYEEEQDRVDPMVRIFPTVAKCNFRAIGASGTVQIHDTMCILAVNIINQKIFILYWFWLIGLAALTGAWLLFRLLTILSKGVRSRVLKYRGRMAGNDYVDRISRKCDLGDWFLLDQLGRAIEPTMYGEFLRELGKELELASGEGEPPMMFES